MYSSVDKETYYRAGHEPIHREEYWVKGLRHSVYFTNAVRLAVGSGHTTFLELAPNPVALMRSRLPRSPRVCTTRSSSRRSSARRTSPLGVLAALAQLYVHGHAVDLLSLLPPGDFAVGSAYLVVKPYWLDIRVDSSGSPASPVRTWRCPTAATRGRSRRRGHRPGCAGHRCRGAGAARMSTLAASVPHAALPASGR